MAVESVADGGPLREVRLGLVFNGGVSLAIWMGGVTHEIDAVRRASQEGDDTAALYGGLMGILRQTVRVDVIAGASAGGINGALLAAAIAADKPLVGLRETWLEKGDISGLMRSPSDSDPPSLLQGNEVLLAALREKTDEALRDAPAAQHPIYLYIAATNIHGRECVYRSACDPPAAGCSRWAYASIADEQAAILIAALLIGAMVVAALVVETGAAVRAWWRRP